jgi:2-succinyl-6-hydroxy-2,4-cyclohexadiene-1-carboxylate synthase
VTDGALPLSRHGHGPPLLLLHGYTGSGQSMAGLARSLERDYETLAPDLPGHGRTVLEPVPAAYDFDECLRRLVATLESTGRRRAHWLGYSMGARLALGCAVRHPGSVASLVLLAGRAGIEDPAERAARRAADEALAARLESRGIEAFVDEWLAQPLFATLRRLGAEFFDGERQARLANDARGLAASLRGLGPAAQPALFDALPGVRVPVLLVAGALDPRFVELAHGLARRLPQAEVCLIPDAGHAAHLERPETFARAVREFLRRVDGPAPPLASLPAQETAS